MSVWQLIRVGGFTMYVLLSCSVISLAIIVERYMYFRRRSRIKRTDFMQMVKREVSSGDIKQALAICRKHDIPSANVVHAGLTFYGHDEKEISNNMEREILIETMTLEKFTAIVGTIGSTAVYIGLFGTVLGIIRAFHDISVGGAGGVSVVISGISEALACTAAGLCVAVPAVIAYNYFIRRIDNFIKDMELCASETMDLMTSKRSK
jgi:biopolymer transport protein ExbB